MKKTENKEKLVKITKNILPSLLFQMITIIAIALISFLFMTWFVVEVFDVKDTYEAMGYELIGTLVIFVLTVAPLNVAMHRRRVKEVTTLYDAIKNVADGNYATRISINQKEAIAPIYTSFNKMCAELESEFFKLLDSFELDDISYLNEVDRHYEHFELTEASLYDRAKDRPETVEEAAFRNIQYIFV